MPSSRGCSWPRDWARVSCGSYIAGGFFTTEPLGKPPQGIYIPIYLSSLYRNWGPHSIGGWQLPTEHKIPGALSCYHQRIRRKSHTLQPSFQILPITTSPRKPSGSCLNHLFSLLGSVITLSLLPTLTVWSIWRHICVGHTNLCSVTRVYGC